MTSLATDFRAISRPFHTPSRPGRPSAGRLFRQMPRKAHSLQDFSRAVFAGLSAPLRSIPCKYLYDPLGSELFEAITQTAEYYPTRCEIEILHARAHEIAARTAPDSWLLEFGSGSSVKTEILLDAMPRLRAYAPIDVSSSALRMASLRLSGVYPNLDIRPIIADFACPFDTPVDLRGCPRIGFFPGSTIGNFMPGAAGDLLEQMARILAGGTLVVGVDLVKDVDTLVRAYDDASGVTAAFNLNLLGRINRELGADFDIDLFRHEAIWNSNAQRIEMRLVSLCNQKVTIAGRTFAFQSGERIHTENSYKYTVESFQSLAIEAGFAPQAVWTDDRARFSVHLLRAA